MHWIRAAALLAVVGAPVLSAAEVDGRRDTMPDTWVATDSLGRRLPGFAECGPPRTDRTVAIFYFLWLGPHAHGGPYDISKILGQHPAAMSDPTSALWGPLGSPHHWGESLFGYYNSDDPYVLTKHAQMLSDAGVDVVIFDVTNQHTYFRNVKALLEAFARVRRHGGKTPQVAFLCPFWTPAAVVRELYRDLYEPGLHPDLWFQWEGKPLILADPDRLGRGDMHDTSDVATELTAGHSLGQSFATERLLAGVEVRVPTWRTTAKSCQVALFEHGPQGRRLMQQTCQDIRDNDWVGMRLTPPLPPGRYYLELTDPKGRVGWWSSSDDTLVTGSAFADGQPVGGDRALRLIDHTTDVDELREFFTFRAPQPDYFQGPLKPDMWSWLEVFPQHVYRNSHGEKEQMSVGVAQNAVDGRLGSMSEAGARGRSFHDGHTDQRPGAVAEGLNFAEQFQRALAEDPRLIFVTGWNEWIAGLHHEFNGVQQPVMFVDQFDQEHSRDIEPMKGGHGDAYYYQLVSSIRRYKGVRAIPTAGPSRTIRIDHTFSQWEGVEPVFLDDAGDTLHRDWPGYNDHTRYVNQTGRNDIARAQVARDGERVCFHVRSVDPLTAPEGEAWMLLLIDRDGRYETGWEGYDLLVNRSRTTEGRCTVEENTGGWQWRTVGEAELMYRGRDLHLAVARDLLGGKAEPLRFDFTWADNIQPGEIMSFLTDGDAAPNGRSSYGYREAAAAGVETP